MHLLDSQIARDRKFWFRKFCFFIKVRLNVNSNCVVFCTYRLCVRARVFRWRCLYPALSCVTGRPSSTWSSLSPSSSSRGRTCRSAAHAASCPLHPSLLSLPPAERWPRPHFRFLVQYHLYFFHNSGLFTFPRLGFSATSAGDERISVPW